MTSFELFKLLQFDKIYISYILLYFFLLKYIICDKLHPFMKNFKYFASNYGIITSVIIKLCEKSHRKESGWGLKI